MNKKWMYVTVLSMLAAILLLLPYSQQTEASSDGYIYWGEEKSAEYYPLHPYTLNWSGDVLDRGGMNLSTLTITSNSSDADFVINQYGALGARSVAKQSSRDLTERTSVYQQGGLNSITMSQGDIYLIRLSNSKYAKIRIDSIFSDRVLFSYVLEAEAPAPTAAPTPTPTPWIPETPGGSQYPGGAQYPNETQYPGGSQAPNEPQYPGGSQYPVTTPIPSSAPSAPVNHQVIVLTVGQKQAFVNNQSSTLLEAPTVKNGTTLVPLRFITTSMGVKVDWNSKEQKITLTDIGKVIILYINSKHATINGQSTTLLTAPIVSNGTTLVPIRFISENFDMKVNYDPATKKITITSGSSNSTASGGSSASSGSSTPSGSNSGGGSISTGGTAPAGSITPGSLYGAWKLTGPYGREAGGVAIFEDGTYIHRVMYEGEKKGRWRYAEAGEVPELSNAIILQYGYKNVDWAVGYDAQGNFAMYYRILINAGGLYGGREYGWSLDTYGTKHSDRPEDVKQIRMSSIEYDYTKYYGTWSLWIEGGPINIYNPATGEYMGHRFSEGADGGTLIVNANGTYTLKTYLVTQTGTWRGADYNEVPGYNGAIILEAGDGKQAWAMYGTLSGKTALSYDSGGKYTDGSSIWIIQFVLDKKS